MKNLFERHYQAIVKRGLITEKTTVLDFIDKFDEETKEFKKELGLALYFEPNHYKQEAIDCICVLTNMLQHYGVDIESELIKNIEIQEKRANETNRKINPE